MSNRKFTLTDNRYLFFLNLCVLLGQQPQLHVQKQSLIQQLCVKADLMRNPQRRLLLVRGIQLQVPGLNESLPFVTKCDYSKCMFSQSTLILSMKTRLQQILYVILRSAFIQNFINQVFTRWNLVIRLGMLVGGRQTLVFFYDNFNFLWSINIKLCRLVDHIKTQVAIDCVVNCTVQSLPTC